MSRRPVNPSRGSGLFSSSKSKSSPVLSVGLIVLGGLFLVFYLHKGSGGSGSRLESVNRVEEEETEAWGVEPYDIEDADSNCKGLIRRGIVRVADIKFPLPYRPKSFSLVIVSDALDFLSPRYLNKTLPDLARVSGDGIAIFTGLPGNQKAKVADVSKFGRAAKMRSSSWWVKFFQQINLEENEAATKKFEQASKQGSYVPRCQIFHLKSLS
ncbi:hypothetical protein AAHE18_17G242300 [Arachis hypogaea]